MSSEEEEKEIVEKKSIPTWAIWAGSALTLAVAGGTVIYMTHQNRKKELKDKRYENNSSFFGKFTKYWGLTTNTFSSVKSVIWNFFNLNNSPTVNAKQAQQKVYSSEEESDEYSKTLKSRNVVLEDGDL